MRFYYKKNPFPFYSGGSPYRLANALEVCDMVKEMNSFVNSRGAVFAVVAMPVPVFTSQFRNMALQKGHYPPPELSIITFRSCMNGSGIPFFDTQPEFENAVREFGKDRFFLPDNHLNARGHEFFYETIKDFENKLLISPDIKKRDISAK